MTDDVMTCRACLATVHDYYMVTDRVWHQATSPATLHWRCPQAVKWPAHVRFRLMAGDSGFLHLRCLESRIGRALTLDDFPPLPVNDAIRAVLGGDVRTHTFQSPPYCSVCNGPWMWAFELRLEVEEEFRALLPADVAAHEYVWRAAHWHCRERVLGRRLTVDDLDPGEPEKNETVRWALSRRQ